MKKLYLIFTMLATCLVSTTSLHARADVDSVSVVLPSTDSISVLKKDIPDSLHFIDTLSVEYEVSTLTDEYLDTLDINKKLLINDYSMIGINYGGSINMMHFNPTLKNATFFTPHTMGITYTKYCKMFNYMPYFGIQLGLYYGQDGYLFKPNAEDKIAHIDGATSAVYDYLEIPALAHLHVDIWRIKLMVNLGMYGGYRLKVHREGFDDIPEEYLDHFYPYENRLDYGFKGGLGIGFIFAPCELHINATYRHSLSSIFKPDYASEYYYRYAYPMNLAITVGLHFHLSKRTGRSTAQLRKEAYQKVFNPSTEEVKK